MGTVPVWENANVLEIRGGDGYSALQMFSVSLLCTPEGGSNGKCYVVNIFYHNEKNESEIKCPKSSKWVPCLPLDQA